jgi:ion channel-forming bestrophin family protein
MNRTAPPGVRALAALSWHLVELLVLVGLYCLVVGLVVRWLELRPIEWGAEVALVNSLILGLLLGFRNRAAYDRWWEGRRLWGQLVNDSRNLLWKAGSYLPPEVIARSRLGELVTGFAVALERHLRGTNPRLRDIPGFEKEEDNPSHVPLYLAGRVHQAVAGWVREGLIDTPTALVFDPHLRGLLDVCGACERIRNTGISPSYKAVLRVGLGLNILVDPWYTPAELGLWGIPVFLLVCFFLLGVELIDTAVEEPFGTGPDDLDLDSYCGTIAASVREILDFSGRTIPPPTHF